VGKDFAELQELDGHVGGATLTKADAVSLTGSFEDYVVPLRVRDETVARDGIPSQSPRSPNASNFEAQKYTAFTIKIFRPGSNSGSSAVAIAGSYHVFLNPKMLPSSGITSRVVVS
jgi:hypothetical protein